MLLHPVPTSADAGPDLCALCPDLFPLHPDLFPCTCGVSRISTGSYKHSTCKGGGCHQLQLDAIIISTLTHSWLWLYKFSRPHIKHSVLRRGGLRVGTGCLCN